MKRHILFLILSLFLALAIAPAASAQCPMCKMGVESNLKNGGKTGAGLNTGILYMLAAPYLLVGTIGFIWYRNRRKNVDDSIDFSEN